MQVKRSPLKGWQLWAGLGVLVLIPVIIGIVVLTQQDDDSAQPATGAGTDQPQVSAVGERTYDDVFALAAALELEGFDCENLQEAAEPDAQAESQGRCATDDGEFELFIFASSADRDQTVDELSGSLESDDCLVAGRGEQGLWLVSGGGDLEICAVIGDRLDGDVLN